MHDCLCVLSEHMHVVSECTLSVYLCFFMPAFGWCVYAVYAVYVVCVV